MAGNYEKVIKAVEQYLEDTGSLGPDRSKSTKEVVKALRDKIAAGELDVGVGDSAMIGFLAKAAHKDDNSGIVTNGPWTGYWYEPPTPKPVDEPENVPEQGTPGPKERDLYPLMELWLQEKGYVAKDMANLKGGGSWGNPDIIGVDVDQLMGL